MQTEPNSAPAPVLRDREHERIFLTAAAASLPDHDARAFAPCVLARLDGHGGMIAARSLAQLVHELAEEAEDIAGWALLADELYGDDSPILRDDLADLARRGAEAWAAVGRLGRVIG